MPDRHTNEDKYRYGYNGMEMDNEAKGNGNSYTTEFRQYDPRLGRWLSLDPLMEEFPNMSPYVAFNNNPVFFIDPTGLKGEPVRDDILGKLNNPPSEQGSASNNQGGWNGFKDTYDAIGRKAHSAFANYMRAVDVLQGGGKWQSEKSLPPPVAPSGGDKNLRPDLLYIGGDDGKGSVWELKPLSFRSNKEGKKDAAKAQIAGYVNRLNKLKYKEKKWSGGNSNGTPAPISTPIVVTDGEYKFSIWVEDAKMGLLVYEVLDGPKKVPQEVPVPVAVPVKKPEPVTPSLIPIILNPNLSTVIYKMIGEALFPRYTRPSASPPCGC